jgi:hypothetical protein
MALRVSPLVTGFSSTLSSAKCSIIQLLKAPSVALAFGPLANHIKHWEVRHVSMKGYVVTMGLMPQPGVGTSTQAVLMPLLIVTSCFFSPPSAHTRAAMVRIEARHHAMMENEEQSSQETAEKYVRVFEKSEGIRLTKIRPTIDASNLDKPANVKRCSVCGYSKLLVDFAETASSKDKRRDACRACSAAKRARRFEGRELYHLELTPEKAWERAKICTKCGVRKGLRDFYRHQASKDGIRAQCRSCKSNYEKSLPAVLPVDIPHRCNNCNEIKPAADYSVRWRGSTGLCNICKLCKWERNKERYPILRQSNAIDQRHDKVCTTCGQLKLASEFAKQPRSPDGLACQCKSCQFADYSIRYQQRKARKTMAAPPYSN